MLPVRPVHRVATHGMHKQFFIAAWKECRQQPRSFITDPDSPALAASGGRRIA